MNGELIALRLLHIVGGVVWVGGVVLMHFVLLPSMAQAGPAAGPVMAAIPQQRLFRWLPTIAVVTMLAGLRLLWIVSGGVTSGWFLTWPGHAYSVGAVLALVGFLVAMLVSRPSAMRVGQLTAQLAAGGSDQDQATLRTQIGILRGRAARFGGLSTTMLLAATALMGVARYL